MSDFNPSPHDQLTIGGRTFHVMPHPFVPTFAFGQEGRKAFVYQLANGDGAKYALKKFKPVFRVPELVEVCDALARFAQWPGLEVCARECLRPKAHRDTLAQHPDLEYAVLMPWIDGHTWYDIVIGSKPLTRLDALTAANATAQALAALEEAGLAHCDIAAPNVIVNLAVGQAHLIDVEDLYAPGFNPPAALPAGTEGYAHKTASDGLWGPTADRFAGAVMLAEMTAWHTPEVRQASDEEHYFGAKEAHTDCPRYGILTRALAGLDQRLAELFEQAWRSDRLEDCPPIKSWQAVISEAFHREQLSKVVATWQPIAAPGAAPEAAPKPIAAPAPVEKAAPPVSPIAAPVIEPAPAQPASKPITVASPAPSGKIAPMPAAGPVAEWRPLSIAPPLIAPTDNNPPATASAAGAPVTRVGLIKPLLDLSHVDKHNRPFLVWTECPGATHYILQESKSPDFEPAKEHRVKADQTRWHPTLGRAGQLHYRAQARSDDDAGPWSDTLTVRIGTA